MAIRLTLRCERCGAPSVSEGAWVLCKSCGTWCGFDFTVWLDSDQWTEFNRRAMADPEGYMRRFERHGQALDQASAQARGSSPGQPAFEAALEAAAREADWLMAEMPSYVPPRVLTNHELRRRYARWIGFDLLHARLGGRVSALYTRLNQATAALGFGANENPMEAVKAMLAVLRELAQARQELGSPPDPEGLSFEARLRIASSQMLSAYLRLIAPEHQGPVLEMIYGQGSVEVVGPASHDYSLYFDWECPRCGLFSLQGHGVEVTTCPGCFCRRRFDVEFLKLGALAQPCPSCGARVEFARGAPEARCDFCTTTQRRFAATGAAQRLLSREVRLTVAAQHGLPQEIPEQEGLEVSAATRLQRQAEGVARMAQWFHMFVTPARIYGLARASAKESTSALFAAALQIVMAEGPPEAVKLLQAAQRKSPAGPASEAEIP
ncbi:MAG: hypothetical protein BroJett014_32200 [Planctomycetota bacterium]|nr:hypothetical protein [Planctomycetota bacterium]GIK54247.1 MAG: hypothetical protein BroJett014_32200 [Planctomycetota bacterium]